MGWLLAFLSFLFRCIPRSLALATGAALGWVWYYLIPVRRKVAWNNLRQAFPDKTEKERRRIARACYGHMARSAIEFLRLGEWTPQKIDDLIEHHGLDNYEQGMAKGRGLVVVTAHYGNFDLLACTQALRGVPVHIITREQHVGSINRFWMSQRARFGLGLVPAKDSALRIHRLLKQKQVVAMVVDQHMPEGRGIPVPFFGRPAATTHAPAMLAWSTGAPILPVTIQRLKGGRHRVDFDPPVNLDRDADRGKEIVRVTTEINHWLEEKIRAEPSQWLWIHRRWKIPPE